MRRPNPPCCNNCMIVPSTLRARLMRRAVCLELCRKVRLEHKKGDVYLIMLTMRTQEHDQLRALAAGADDYISKAAPAAAILERLDAARRAQTATHFSLSGDLS